MTIYAELRKKADPFVKSFRDDLLVHDRNDIKDHPGTPFLHFTGETGTHMVLLNRAEEYPKKGEMARHIFGYVKREQLLKSSMSVVPGMEKRYGRGDLALHYNGVALKEISYKRAEEIADDYVEEIERAWRKNEIPT